MTQTETQETQPATQPPGKLITVCAFTTETVDGIGTVNMQPLEFTMLPNQKPTNIILGVPQKRADRHTSKEDIEKLLNLQVMSANLPKPLSYFTEQIWIALETKNGSEPDGTFEQFIDNVLVRMNGQKQVLVNIEHAKSKVRAMTTNFEIEDWDMALNLAVEALSQDNIESNIDALDLVEAARNDDFDEKTCFLALAALIEAIPVGA